MGQSQSPGRLNPTPHPALLKQPPPAPQASTEPPKATAALPDESSSPHSGATASLHTDSAPAQDVSVRSDSASAQSAGQAKHADKETQQANGAAQVVQPRQQQRSPVVSPQKKGYSPEHRGDSPGVSAASPSSSTASDSVSNQPSMSAKPSVQSRSHGSAPRHSAGTVSESKQQVDVDSGEAMGGQDHLTTLDGPNKQEVSPSSEADITNLAAEVRNSPDADRTPGSALPVQQAEGSLDQSRGLAPTSVGAQDVKIVVKCEHKL